MCGEMSSWWEGKGAMTTVVVIVLFLFFVAFYCINMNRNDVSRINNLKSRSEKVAILLAIPKREKPQNDPPMAIPIQEAEPLFDEKMPDRVLVKPSAPYRGKPRKPSPTDRRREIQKAFDLKITK